MRVNSENLSKIQNHISCPKYDRQNKKTGIVHIGVGGFHRSHQAFYLHQYLSKQMDKDWAICGIGLRKEDHHMAIVMEEQDCLYTLITQHPDGKENIEIIGSITDYILAPEDPSKAIDKMAHSDTKIVSLTITEGAYNFNPSNGQFDFENPDIKHELQYPDEPKTIFGYLTRALKKRRDTGLSPFTVLSCDNIIHNGDIAKNMLLAFVEKQDKDLYNWIKENVSFPNSMVDLSLIHI